jgi:uncharacterized damage-inducible protein DinB
MIFAAALCASQALAQTATIGQVVDNDIKMVESEVVRLAEAMPADKYDFAPTLGEFKGVKTFSQQMTHVAADNFAVASAALGEPNPSSLGENENGPESIKGKEAVVKYLKDSFTYAHKAAAALTAENAMDILQSPIGMGKVSRLSMLSLVTWHTFDHYGQSVVYARMNGIIPPASQPPPSPLPTFPSSK